MVNFYTQSKTIGLNNQQNQFKWIRRSLLMSFLIIFAINAEAQVNITGSASWSSGQTCADNCEGTATDGDRGDYCDDIEWTSNPSPVYCPATWTIEGDLWDSETVWPTRCTDADIKDCRTQESQSYTHYPGHDNMGSTTYQVGNGSSGCWRNLTWNTYRSSGTWPLNINSSGVWNGSICSYYTASNVSSTGNWTVASNQTMDCTTGTTWYRVYFGGTNKQFLRFRSVKDNGAATAWTSVNTVRYSSSSSGCASTCNLSDNGGAGAYNFGVDNPAPGYYFVAVSESTVWPASDNIEKFHLNVEVGGNLSSYDNICSARNFGQLDPGDTFTDSRDNGSYTSENQCSLSEPGGQDNTVWYTFTVGSTNQPTTIYFDVDAGSVCTGWARLYRGNISCPFNWSSNGFSSLTYLEDIDVGVGDYYNCPSAGTYYMQVDITGLCSTGSYSMEISSPNKVKGPDAICSALPVGTGTINAGGSALVQNNFSNYCATDQSGEPNTSGSDETVWYYFTTGSTVGQWIEVDVDAYDGTGGVCAGGVTTAGWVRIYEWDGSGCSFGDISQVGSNNDITGVTQDRWTIDCPKANTRYYVQVETGGLSTCDLANFDMTVTASAAPPANDKPCGAYTLATVPAFGNNYTKPGLTNQSNVNATNCNEPNPDWTLSSNNHGVWYKTQAPGRTLVLDAKNTGSDNIDVKLAVYQNKTGTDDCNLLLGDGPGSGDYVDREWDTGIPALCVGGLCGETMIVTCLDPTRDVYIMVDGANDLLGYDEGTFELRSYYPYEGATDFCNYSAANWDGTRFLGTVPDSGSFTVRNLSNFCGVSSMPAGAPDMPSLNTDKAVFFRFRTPDADAFGEGSVKITATSDPVIGDDVGFLSGDEINLELMVLERTGGTCSSGIWQIKGSSDGLATVKDGPYSESLIVNCLNPFTDYFLVVDGVNGLNEQGFFELQFEDYGVKTPNDDQCNAIPFTSNTTQLNLWNACNSNHTVTLTGQNNYCGTVNNEPTPTEWPASSGMVWYSFVAPKSGKLEIRLNTSNPLTATVDDEYLNGMLAVYDLPDGQDICSYVFTNADLHVADYDFDVPPVSSGEDMTVECLIPGRTYYLAVDGEAVAVAGGDDWDRGEFELEFEADPQDSPAPNDNICDAEFLGDIETGPKSSTSLRPRAGLCMSAENNYCATSNGDPDPPGGWPGSFDVDQGVWYSFIAPDYNGNGYGSVNISFNNNPGYASQSDYIHLQAAVFENVGTNCANPQDSFSVQGFDQALTPFDNIDFDVNCLTAGETYYLLVDGATINLEGYFDFVISEIVPTETPPANDDICSATVMSGMWPTIGTTITDANETNRCADLQAIPDPDNFGRDHTVWYSFTTPAGGTTYALEATITSDWPWPFGDAMDPQIALYSSSNGNNCATATAVYEFDDYGLINVPFTETTEFYCLDPGTTYWLMVDGSGLNSQGNFDVDLTSINPKGPTTSDNMCDAAPGQPGDLGQIPTLFGSVFSGTRNNYCATIEAGEVTTITSPLINYTVDNTVWFSFITPSSPGNNINVNFDANSLGGAPTNDGLNLQVAIFQSSDGTCNGTMTEIDAGFDPILWDEDVNDVCLAENTRYWVQIDGWEDGIGFTTDEWRGFFNLTITANGTSSKPTRDDIAHAIANPLTISGTPLVLSPENNDCATTQSGEPGVGTYASRTVWYSFVAPPSADVTINVDGDNCFWPIGGGIDPEIHLYHFSNPATFAGAEEVDMSYIPLNCTVFDEEITPECLKPGERYYLQVDGSDAGLDGDFTLSIVDNQPAYTGPSNNFCANATDLTFHLTGPSGSTSCFYGGRAFDVENYGDPTLSMDPPSGCGQNCGETWYKFTMPATGYVKVEGEDEYGSFGTNNSTLNIVAYDAGVSGACGSMTQLDCGSGGNGSDVEFSITATPGNIIYLQVFNDGGTDMNEQFGICLIEQCSADECLDAVTAGPMEFDSVYCFNLQTMTTEPVSEGYSVGNANDDPTHSTYFQFDTDDFCFGYVLTFEIADIDVGNNDFCPVNAYNNLTVSIFKDDTPCDGNPIVRTVIYETNDCAAGDAINSQVTLLIGDVVPINVPNSLYDDLDTGTTYIIQIDVSAPQVSEGSIVIEKICKGRDFELPPLGSTSSNGYCTTIDNWRHYFNDNGTTAATGNTYPEYPNFWEDDILIFSVFPNGNTMDGVATINVLPNYTSAEDIPNAATYTMRRYWDFDVTSGSIDPAFPVGVKFYYDQSEKDEIIAAAQTFALFPGLVIEPFEWFKTQNGVDFDPSQVHPRYIESKQWSETGQFTPFVFTDFSGVGHFAQDYDEDNTNITCNGIQYVEMQGLTGFSGGTGASGASDSLQSPLPVELISFVGWNDAEVNELEWITASEINNDLFVVERSIDAISFTEIGTVDGSGTTTEEQTYNFTDVSPIEGINYYRLKQIDFDGSFEYSDIIAIELSGGILKTAIVKLHPNPTNRVINIQLQSANNTEFEMNVLDITGRLMETKSITAVKGLNSPFALNVEEYRSGVYIISLFDVNSGQRLEAKFVRE